MSPPAKKKKEEFPIVGFIVLLVLAAALFTADLGAKTVPNEPTPVQQEPFIYTDPCDRPMEDPARPVGICP